jgi:cytochrome c oxidase assembly protein subunit 15
MSHYFSRWMFTCCVLIFIMVVIGGATRLTNSGLSIVEWKPIHGTIPPLNAAEWEEEFLKYKQYPEYQKINKGMSLEEFKGIFWWEYIHRVWGRIIGMAFLLPLLWFAVVKKVPVRTLLPFVGLFGLVCLQGFMGWFMVQSGLKDNPAVSHYRLTVHLLLALILFSLCYWVGLKQASQENTARVSNFLTRYTGAFCVLLFLTITMGGMVAGSDAGLIYNTFPLMEGHIMPPEAFQMQPWWVNLGENPATKQFVHRMLAYATFFAGLGLVYAVLRRAPKADAARRVSLVLFVLLCCQVGLGVATILYHVPVVLGVLHQANAVLVLAAALHLRASLKTSFLGRLAASEKNSESARTN